MEEVEFVFHDVSFENLSIIVINAFSNMLKWYYLEIDIFCTSQTLIFQFGVHTNQLVSVIHIKHTPQKEILTLTEADSS